MTNTIMIHTGRLDLPELEVYRIRNEVQLLRYNEPEPGLFVCESRKVIERALDAGYEPVSFLVSERVKDTVAELLEKGAFR